MEVKTVNSKVKTNVKTKGAQEWLNVTGRRVVELLSSQKLPQRWLAQLGECRSAGREVVGSNPGPGEHSGSLK